mmetsp:Transcript_28377/g.28675  ORF Transcript_28377/g.28675 Transcript_28377/m.28675 type:complete len:261 (+) Transcript_28377:124-906(+)|eukprot:CAMPEP_0182416390 /NCGR_PEP_ID=MMETSP1167-20130531/680_1 /TAXON_ID=2988 /ORGANISM="Mallomonas Sp, Strain CCMP3275" /LENGTH=260 /DNA_ID=CAMNT_0024589109 /DNA_START=109 /DNA_END=891 /DNA_ORIENTATION=+
MSWGASQYDDNPFAETQDIKPAATNTRPNDPTTAPPPWLQDSATPQTDANSGSASQSPNADGNQTSASTPDKEIPQAMLYTRVINLVLSGCIVVACLLSLLTTVSITTGVLACYAIVFACLLCCYETHLKQISKMIALNFGFMYSAKYRCVFILFVGIILFNFSLFGTIVGALMIANSVYNAFIILKYPEFEEIQRKDAQSEIQDFLATNPAFAQTLVTGAVTLAAKNPDVLKHGADAYMKANTNQGNQSAGQPTSHQEV